MFLSCQFCDSDENLNREHIFGSALASRVPPSKIGVPRTARALIEDPKRTRKKLWKRGDNIFSIVSNSICEKCNTRFGQDHGFVAAHIARLSKGVTREIPVEICRPLLRYFQKLGALVDLESSAFDSKVMTEKKSDIDANAHHVTRQYAPILQKNDRDSFRKGEMISNISVYLGQYTGNRHGDLTIAPLLTMEANAEGFSKDLAGKKISIPIGKILCLIVVGLGSDASRRLVQLETGHDDLGISNSTRQTDEDLAMNRNRTTVFEDGTFSIDR